MRVPIRKRLAPGRTQKSLQIPIMRCSAVASLLAYFFSRRQARSRFYRALLAGISNKENKGQSLLSTVRNVFLKTDRSCRRIDHRCCCGESVSIISSDPSLPRSLPRSNGADTISLLNATTGAIWSNRRVQIAVITIEVSVALLVSAKRFYGTR